MRFTTKRREILLTYLTLCRLGEETKVCDRCSLHTRYFQTHSKWIPLARYNTVPANNVNIPKLCGCNFHISRQLSFGAKREDNALQLNLTGVKNVISIWILFYVPANLPVCQKNEFDLIQSIFPLKSQSHNNLYKRRMGQGLVHLTLIPTPSIYRNGHLSPYEQFS